MLLLKPIWYDCSPPHEDYIDSRTPDGNPEPRWAGAIAELDLRASRDRPRLGIELDWDLTGKYPYQRLPLWSFTQKDGGFPLV